MGSRSWAYIERYLGVSLILRRLEMLKDWHLVDEPEGKGRKVICPSLRCRHNEELVIRIKQKLVTDESGSDEGLTNSSKSLDNSPPRRVLEVLCYVVLDRSRIRKVDGLPNEIKKVPKIRKLRI
jgi:hypothetical protein